MFDFVFQVIAHPLFHMAGTVFSAGAVLKFLLSTKIGNKEAIDYLPAKWQAFAAPVVAFVTYIVHGLVAGQYAGADGVTLLLTDVLKALGTGGAAVWIHDVLTFLIPLLAKAEDVIVHIQIPAKEIMGTLTALAASAPSPAALPAAGADSDAPLLSPALQAAKDRIEAKAAAIAQGTVTQASV